jgi:hypothetical protein
MTVNPIFIKVSKNEIESFNKKYMKEEESVRISCNPNEEVWIDTKIGFNKLEDRIPIEGFHFIKKIALYFLEHFSHRGGRFYLYPKTGEARLPENKEHTLIAKLIYMD